MSKLTKNTKTIWKLESSKIYDKVKVFMYDIFSFPFSLIIYPFKGFEEFKRYKQSKKYVAWFYLVMMILVQIVSYNGNGFLVNKNNPNEFNLIQTIILVVFPVFVFVIANWATTALIDGKGSMSDIFKVICYSFFPYVWLGLLSTIISNYITMDEIIFYTFLQSLGILLTVYILFFGLLGIHEYGLIKTIMMIVFTIVAIAIILFIILLFLSLSQQVWSFVQSIFKEFVMRFLVWSI